MASAGVKVTGLREFQKAVRKVSPDMGPALRTELKAVAQNVVVPEAKRRGGASRGNLAGGSTRLGSRGVATIRALATQKSAAVALGKSSVPYTGGHEWGSAGRYRQFPPKSSEGYILFPSVKAKQPEILEAAGKAIEKVSREAFPD